MKSHAWKQCLDANSAPSSHAIPDVACQFWPSSLISLTFFLGPKTLQSCWYTSETKLHGGQDCRRRPKHDRTVLIRSTLALCGGCVAPDWTGIAGPSTCWRPSALAGISGTQTFLEFAVDVILQLIDWLWSHLEFSGASQLPHFVSFSSSHATPLWVTRVP